MRGADQLIVTFVPALPNGGSNPLNDGSGSVRVKEKEGGAIDAKSSSSDCRRGKEREKRSVPRV